MKRPQPDIGDILQSRFINNLANVRKFKRLWGTTYVGGVEVMVERQYYYPNSARSGTFEKLFRFLGAYDDVVNANNGGLRSAWMYLNKNKGSELTYETLGELSLTYKDFVAENLNRMWWDSNDGPMPENLTLTTSIVIEGEFAATKNASVSYTNLLDPTATLEETITAIETNYDSIWDTCLVTQQGVGVINKGSFTDDVTKVVTPDEDDLSPDDPWLSVVARYALRSDGIPCTIKDVEKGYGKTENGSLYYTYVVTLEIPYYSFGMTTPMVEKVTEDLNGTYVNRVFTKLSYPNAYYTQSAIKSMDSTDLEDDPDLVTRVYRLWEDEAVEENAEYASLWIRSGDKWYLKADAFDNPKAYGVSYKNFYEYVLTLVDTGYQKKKVKWWKKALAFVIVVVSIYFLGPVYGLIVGSLILTVAALAFSMAGMDDWATAFMEVNKAIEPLVMIASIYLVVTGIYNAYKAAEVALQEAATAAGKEAAEIAVEDVITEMISQALTDATGSMVDGLIEGAKEVMAGNILNPTALNFLSKMGKLVTMPAQFKLADIRDRNKDLQAEYDELISEMYQENDILMGFAKVYAMPAKADWSIYAAEFDHPYERGGGQIAMGNIQRTTKQAIRKAKYDDPAFDNILVV
jgi:hypothetical protein